METMDQTTFIPGHAQKGSRLLLLATNDILLKIEALSKFRLSPAVLPSLDEGNRHYNCTQPETSPSACIHHENRESALRFLRSSIQAISGRAPFLYANGRESKVDHSEKERGNPKLRGNFSNISLATSPLGKSAKAKTMARFSSFKFLFAEKELAHPARPFTGLPAGSVGHGGLEGDQGVHQRHG